MYDIIIGAATPAEWLFLAQVFGVIALAGIIGAIIRPEEW